MRSGYGGQIKECYWNEIRDNVYLRRQIVRELLEQYWSSGLREAIIKRLRLDAQ